MQWGQGVGSDRRGASEVLGAILVFAILIAAIGVFQVTVVPQTNEEIEFKHSTGVRADVADLRAAMVNTGTDGGRRTVSVRTGVDYPSRSVTVSPPAPRGQLSTSGEVTGAIELQGISATDPEAADFWDGTATFDSRFVTYRPSYNYYGEAPVTRYEPTVVYSSFRDADVAETPQSLVEGRTIDVVLASGSLSRNGVATETVEVTGIRLTMYDPDTQNANAGEVPSELVTNRTGSLVRLGGRSCRPGASPSRRETAPVSGSVPRKTAATST